jgi:predicted metal-dependent phosphoesterase TrpH
MFLGDFHLHSTFSDGKLTIPELVDLFGNRGFGVIAITDHICEEQSVIGKAASILNQTLTRASFPLYREILRSEAERAWDQYRMIVLPGFELSKNSVSNHRSAHILGIGVEEYFPADEDAAILAKRIRGAGGVSVAAHPVSTRKREKQTYHLWDRRNELRDLFDAWEVASGPYLFDEVLESDLPKIASSDLHRPSQMTSWKTVLDCEKHPDAILDAIRKRDLRFQFYREEPMNGLLPCRDFRSDLVFGARPDRARYLLGGAAL